MNMNQIKNNISFAVLAAALALVITAALQTVILFISRVQPVPVFLRLAIPTVAAMLIPVLITGMNVNTTIYQIKKSGKSHAAVSIIFGFGACTGANFLISLLNKFITGSESSGAVTFSEPFDFLLIMIAAGLLPALLEEYLFRGKILPLLIICGSRFSVLLSALLFALIHSGAYNITFAFFAGIILGIIRIGTGRLIPCMAVHLLNNLLALSVMGITKFLSAELGSQIFYITGIAGIIIGLAALPFMVSMSRGKSRPTHNSALRALLTAPMFYIFIITALIMQLL